MSRPSIYQKTCPECASVLHADAVRCECGYAFSTAQPGSGVAPEEEALHNEELYEIYLAARVDQLLQGLHSARDTLSKDPSNLDKAAGLLRAVHTLREARAELDLQAERTEQARRVAALAGSPTATEEFRAAQADRASKITGSPADAGPTPDPDAGNTATGGPSPDPEAPQTAR